VVPGAITIGLFAASGWFRDLLAARGWQIAAALEFCILLCMFFSLSSKKRRMSAYLKNLDADEQEVICRFRERNTLFLNEEREGLHVAAGGLFMNGILRRIPCAEGDDRFFYQLDPAARKLLRAAV
jgi:hypothetical protein